MRHDATHNELPSLSMLRSAANTLLSWFVNNYWHPQHNQLQSLNAAFVSCCYGTTAEVPSPNAAYRAEMITHSHASVNARLLQRASTVGDTLDDERFETESNLSTLTKMTEYTQACSSDDGVDSAVEEDVQRYYDVSKILSADSVAHQQRLKMFQLLNQTTPTLITDTFVPLFQTAVFSAARGIVTSNLPSIDTENLWLSLLVHLSRMNSFAVGIVLTRLCGVAVRHITTSASTVGALPLSSRQVTEIQAVNSWVDIIVKHFCVSVVDEVQVAVDVKCAEGTGDFCWLLDQCLYIKSLRQTLTNNAVIFTDDHEDVIGFRNRITVLDNELSMCALKSAVSWASTQSQKSARKCKNRNLGDFKTDSPSSLIKRLSSSPSPLPKRLMTGPSTPNAGTEITQQSSTEMSRNADAHFSDGEEVRSTTSLVTCVPSAWRLVSRSAPTSTVCVWPMGCCVGDVESGSLLSLTAKKISSAESCEENSAPR
jgi:hypothetical protein